MISIQVIISSLTSYIVTVKETDETFRDIKGSNNLLLSLLFDKIKEREIPLSISDSKRFLQSLYERERDIENHPYPFDFGAFNLSSSSVSSAQNTPSKSSQKDIELIPLWKCFVSSACPTKLSMKFIPASYDDLLKLHSVNLETNRESLSVSIQPKSDVSNIVKNSPCVAKEKEDGEEEEEAGTEEGTEEELMTESEIDKEDPTGAEEGSGRMSFVIPVYLYECQLSNITESLINPWNYANKEDLYEDVTFEADDEVKSPAFKKMSMDMSTGDSSETGGEDGGPSPPFPRPHHERRTTENSDTTEDLVQQCIDLKENYCSSFLHGNFSFPCHTEKLSSQLRFRYFDFVQLLLITDILI